MALQFHGYQFGHFDLSYQRETMPPMLDLTWMLNDTCNSHSFTYPFVYSLNKYRLNTYYDTILGTLYLNTVVKQTATFPIFIMFPFHEVFKVRC